jgi:hypothetical protein
MLADRHLGGQGQLAVVAVHRQAVAITAFLQRANRFERRLARGFDNVLEIGDAEFLHHLGEAPAAFVVAGGEATSRRAL